MSGKFMFHVSLPSTGITVKLDHYLVKGEKDDLGGIDGPYCDCASDVCPCHRANGTLPGRIHSLCLTQSSGIRVALVSLTCAHRCSFRRLRTFYFLRMLKYKRKINSDLE